LQEQTNQRVDYYYDTPVGGGYTQNYTWGRLSAVVFQAETPASGNQNPTFAYEYSYNQAGRVTGNRMLMTLGQSYQDLQGQYAWDNQGRMTSMTYPSGPVMNYQFDSMGRPITMTETACLPPVGSSGACSNSTWTAASAVVFQAENPASGNQNPTFAYESSYGQAGRVTGNRMLMTLGQSYQDLPSECCKPSAPSLCENPTDGQGIVRLNSRRVAIATLGIGLAGLLMSEARSQYATTPVPRSNQPAHPASIPTSDGYVDPALCERCHAAIANQFRRTGMGRSFYRLRAGSLAENFTAGTPFYHETSDSYFATMEHDGKYYQRRWQKGFDGRETNVDEKQVDFVMGSGNHVRTYLHLTEHNTLQQLPLSWYAEKGGYWAMSPGFDRPDYPGSTRLVTYECMFCHNAYPKIPAGHDEVGARPQFLQPLPEGIDCQRCHGPGRRHIETAARAGPKVEEIRASIVNPKRLNADRELEVCMQCHLETTTVALPHAIRRLDRGPFSYVPGQPLGDFRLTFDRLDGMGDRFELAYGAYRMRQSQCFLRSQGKLRCTTCHDPHNVTRGEAATVRYNAICLGCHAAVLDRAIDRNVASGAHAAGANCVSCHMPTRRADDAVHVVMTDHLIRSRQPAGDLLADKVEVTESPATAYRGEVVPYYPAKLPGTDEQAALYVALAQILEWSNLKNGLPQLESLIEKYRPQRAEYYADLAEGLIAAGERAQAMPWFEEAARHAPGSAIILRKLGSAQMESGQLAKAEATLRRVTELAPDDAAAWVMLGQVLWRENRRAEARAGFAKGINRDPELPELHSSLAAFLLADGDAAGAEREFREEIRIQPGNAKARANLASLLASRGAFPEARYHFEQSIRAKPDYAEARLNYARLLASNNETGEAEKQARAAIEADSGISGAHLLLGALLEARGDVDGAERELQTAVGLQPDLWRAHFELGDVMVRKGDIAGAKEHLRIAAGGTDAEAKALAQELLQKLGR
jgi:predicted CXXCH cytochrome family protein